MTYPKGYNWLGTVGALPRTIQEALALHGTLETPGAADNPKIIAWAAEVGKVERIDANVSLILEMNRGASPKHVP